MTDAEYRADSSLNFSLAKYLVSKTPAHFQAALKEDRETTLDMELGLGLHRWFLEGIAPDYVLQPELAPDGTPWHGGKNICKAWKREQEMMGKVIFTSKTELRQVRMIANLGKHETFQTMLNCAEAKEHAIIGEYRGLKIKGKIDLWGRDKDGAVWIGDIKKCVDASPRGFCSKCASMYQRMQATWYSTLLSMELGLDEPPMFMWIAIEDSEAAPVEIYQHTPQSDAIGRKQMDRAIDLYIECTSTDQWPSYNSGITEISTLPWEANEL